VHPQSCSFAPQVWFTHGPAYIVFACNGKDRSKVHKEKKDFTSTSHTFHRVVQLISKTSKKISTNLKEVKKAMPPILLATSGSTK